MFNFGSIQSQFGTYVNDALMNDGKIDDGDMISLVDPKKILDQQNLDMYSDLSFILRRIKTAEPFSPQQNGNDKNGEIIFTTKTECIDLTWSDDEEGNKNKFADDYEIGEPSTKNVDDSVNDTKPPMRQDPVSKVNRWKFHLFLLIFAFKINEL